MKNKKKLLFIMSIIILFTFGLSNLFTETKNIKVYAKSEEISNFPEKYSINEINTNGPINELNKTAELVDSGRAKITLQASGSQNKVDIKNTDIVLVIDTSNSMKGAVLDKVKEAANSFIDDIWKNGDTRIRIGLVTFNKSAKSHGFFSEDIENKNKNVLQKKIVNLATNQGTNTGDAIINAKELLDQSKTERPNSERFVILFTDGLPTKANNQDTNQLDDNFVDNYNKVDKLNTEEMNLEKNKNELNKKENVYKETQKIYYQYFSPVNREAETINIGGIVEGHKEESYKLKKDRPYKYIDFYTIGFINNNKDNDKKNRADRFLPTIQNVIDKEKYKETYFTNEVDAITPVFNDIKDKISSDINTTIVNDIVIKDTITKEFSIDKSSIKVYSKSGDKNIELNSSRYNTEIVTDNGCDSITVKVDKMTSESIESLNGSLILTFEVILRDKYFSDSTTFTNVGKATIDYTDPITNEKYVDREFPQDLCVDIAPKQANISVTKKVIDYKGEAISCNEEFDINIKNQNEEKFVEDTIKVIPGGKASTVTKRIVSPTTIVEQGSTTKVVDTETPCFVVGNYKITEPNLSDEYILDQIEVTSYNSKNEKTTSTFSSKSQSLGEAGFNINSDNLKVEIVVINKLKRSPGTINITKEIVEKDSKDNWVKVDDNKINPNDTFSIGLNRVENEVKIQEKYNFDLLGNKSTGDMIFYIGNRIDEDASSGFIPAGTYTISEVIPMNYRQVDIQIKDSEGNWVPLEDNKILIDENTKKINIKVRNTLVNDKYWQDKDTKVNVLKYNTKPKSIALSSLRFIVANIFTIQFGYFR